MNSPPLPECHCGLVQYDNLFDLYFLSGKTLIFVDVAVIDCTGVVDSGMFIPNPDFSIPDPDPGFMGQKSTGSGNIGLQLQPFVTLHYSVSQFIPVPVPAKTTFHMSLSCSMILSINEISTFDSFMIETKKTRCF